MSNNPQPNKISIRCQCGKRLTGPASAIGKSIVCPACGRRLHLSRPEPVPAQPVPPSPPPPRRSAQSQPALQDALDADSTRCENCGANMPEGAVLCVECGYHMEQGEVLTRTAAAKGKKKSRKGRRGSGLA